MSLNKLSKTSKEDIEFDLMQSRIESRSRVIVASFKGGVRTVESREYANGKIVSSAGVARESLQRLDSNAPAWDNSGRAWVNAANAVAHRTDSERQEYMSGAVNSSPYGLNSSVEKTNTKLSDMPAIDCDSDYEYVEGQDDAFISFMQKVMSKLGWMTIGACCYLMFLAIT